MSINAEYQKQAYTESVTLKDRAIKTEAKINGINEEGKIVCASAKVMPISVKVEDGRAEFTAKTIFSVLYEEDGALGASEGGVEFTSDFKDERIKSGDKVTVFYSVERTTYRRANGETYAESYVKASAMLETKKEKEYLSGGEGLITRRITRKIETCSGVYKSPYFVEDEIEINGVVRKAFLTDASVYVTGAESENGKATVYGGTEVSFAYETSEGKTLQIKKNANFFAEVDGADISSGDKIVAKTTLKGLKINVLVDENKKTSQVGYSVSTEVYAKAYGEREMEIAADCYSREYNLIVTTGNAISQNAERTKYITDRVSGEGITDGLNVAGIVIVATCYPRFTLTEIKTEKDKTTLTGVMECRIIYKADGGYFSADVSLPVNQTYDFTLRGAVDCNVVLTGVNAYSDNGKIYVEGILNISVNGLETESVPCIDKVEEGDRKEKIDSALSICFFGAGTTLWDAAKATDSCEEEIVEANKDLVFPLEKDARILVYRPQRIEY